MIHGLSCKVKEENWEEQDPWQEVNRSGKAQALSRQERGKKRRAAADLQEEDFKIRKKQREPSPASPQDVTALYHSTSPK